MIKKVKPVSEKTISPVTVGDSINNIMERAAIIIFLTPCVLCFINSIQLRKNVWIRIIFANWGPKKIEFNPGIFKPTNPENRLCKAL
jgi:hypothetical protein